MGLPLMECSYFDIKNSLKMFHNIVYALFYARQVVIISILHALDHTFTNPTRHYVEGTEPR